MRKERRGSNFRMQLRGDGVSCGRWLEKLKKNISGAPKIIGDKKEREKAPVSSK